jgi:hypothetical protein
MFCPKCGRADQVPDTYCRQCGVLLPDLTKSFKPAAKPKQHIVANTVLSSMTIVTSFTLAILLWVVLAFRPETHPLIYVTAGFLFAMGCWHIQSLWRSILLRRQLKRHRLWDIDGNDRHSAAEAAPAGAEKLLETAEFDDMVPASVTERTTRQLAPGKKQSTQS